MGNVIITNIQHFSLGDGPGIRTTVFFKGCSLHCPWCHNPETISPEIDELYGRRCTVDDVMAEVMEDLDFYRESGGGVTLSGGEPLLQAEAAVETAEACRQEGITVLLDTAGNVDAHLLGKVTPHIDECYFDLKSGTEEGYSAVGGSLKRTLDNMKTVVSAGVPTVARIPVIPGFNDCVSSAEQMADALMGIAVKRVDLLPFHRWGSSKYKALGKTYAYRNTPSMPAKHLDPLIEVFQRRGYKTAIGG